MSLLEEFKEAERRKSLGLPEQPLSRPSFAARTGQAKQLHAAYALAAIGGVLSILGFFRPDEAFGPWALGLGCLTSGVAFVWQSLAVRCPQCGVAVVWHTFNTRKHSEAQQAALTQEVCPKCGYDPP